MPKLEQTCVVMTSCDFHHCRPSSFFLTLLPGSLPSFFHLAFLSSQPFQLWYRQSAWVPPERVQRHRGRSHGLPGQSVHRSHVARHWITRVMFGRSIPCLLQVSIDLTVMQRVWTHHSKRLGTCESPIIAIFEICRLLVAECWGHLGIEP
jgi:hypothetical protein